MGVGGGSVTGVDTTESLAAVNGDGDADSNFSVLRGGSDPSDLTLSALELIRLGFTSKSVGPEGEYEAEEGPAESSSALTSALTAIGGGGGNRSMTRGLSLMPILGPRDGLLLSFFEAEHNIYAHMYDIQGQGGPLRMQVNPA